MKNLFSTLLVGLLLVLSFTMFSCKKGCKTCNTYTFGYETKSESNEVTDQVAPEEVNSPSGLSKYKKDESMGEQQYPSQIQNGPESKKSISSTFNNSNDEEVIVKDYNTEGYNIIKENDYLAVNNNPLSTFSIDVDNASYTNCRRYLDNNTLPPIDAVRIEEFINYFDYQYPQPTGKHPFSINTEISECPWNKNRKLIHIGLQGVKHDFVEMAPINLVFLIDVSGSMEDKNKLPLLKQSFGLLVKKLRPQDKIAMVVYAGAAGLVLPATSGSEKNKILDALDNLQAGGSTAGGEGIELAYKIAKENLIKNGHNRVILATDGDFNIGASSDAEMTRLIEDKRKDDIFISVLGFGMGNYKDSKMESIADNGNGNYFYIDNINEAKKVFVTDIDGTLNTIAKDVKIQVEFNPAKVKAYRLVGYENRMLKKEDFNDDKKDAGELGAGHTVTALYEIIPADSKEDVSGSVDALKYQQTVAKNTNKVSNEILTVKFRYKSPQDTISKLIVHPLLDKQVSLSSSSENFKFSAAVASFGMLLRDSKYKGDLSYEGVIELAKSAVGADNEGYRTKFIKLVKTASLLNDLNSTRR